MRTKQLHVPFERGEYAFGYVELLESGILKLNVPFISQLKERVYLSLVGYQNDEEGNFVVLMNTNYKPSVKDREEKEDLLYVLESKDIDMSNDDPVVLERFEGDILDFTSYAIERLQG